MYERDNLNPVLIHKSIKHVHSFKQFILITLLALQIAIIVYPLIPLLLCGMCDNTIRLIVY